MIILDTNVVSELMREQPASSVSEWIQSFDANQFAVTAITVAEIMRGLLRLPEGKRRQKLTQNFNRFINHAFNGRIWAFDEQIAFLYGDIAAHREQEGLDVDPVDLMIAAIANYHSASIATRNTKDFESCGVNLINPWQTN